MSKENLNSAKKKINYATLLLVAYDIIAVNLAYFLALWFRFDCEISIFINKNHPHHHFTVSYAKFVLINTALCIFVFFLLKMYKSLWRFAGLNDLLRIATATVITTICHWIGITFLFEQMLLSYHLFGAIIQFVLLVIARFGYRVVL